MNEMINQSLDNIGEFYTESPPRNGEIPELQSLNQLEQSFQIPQNSFKIPDIPDDIKQSSVIESNMKVKQKIDDFQKKMASSLVQPNSNQMDQSVEET